MVTCNKKQTKIIIFLYFFFFFATAVKILQSTAAVFVAESTEFLNEAKTRIDFFSERETK